MTKKYLSDLIKNNIEQLLKKFIDDAAKANFQISIDQINLEPLAMGNYRFEPKVTTAWHKKYMSFDELMELVNCFVTLKREPVFHDFSENEISISEMFDDKIGLLGVMKSETYEQYMKHVEQQKEIEQNEHSIDSPENN